MDGPCPLLPPPIPGPAADTSCEEARAAAALEAETGMEEVEEEEPDDLQTIGHAFFHSPQDMQRAISVFCGAVHKQNTDIITPTILVMLNSTLQMQLTAVGWQPFKSRDLTYPYHAMTSTQRGAILSLLREEHEGKWMVFDHAMIFKKGFQVMQLKPLDVLGALCTLVLASDTYPDKRLRLAVCNILLQRVQASMVLDKHTQIALNQRLFPVAPTPTAMAKTMEGGGAISPLAGASAH